MCFKKYTLLSLFAAFLTCNAVNAQIKGWRGDGTGRYPDAKPVKSWQVNDNVVWKTSLNEFSNSTPILVNGKLYVCKEKTNLLCLDAKTGKLLWERSCSEDEILTPEQKAEREATIKSLQPVVKEKKKLDAEFRKVNNAYRKNRKDKELRKQVNELRKQQRELEKKLAPLNEIMPETHKVDGYSSPTPVTDGKNIYVCFATGLAAAFTPDGKRLWLKVIEKPTHRWGFCSSPAIADGKLILNYATVRALEPETGKVLWEVKSKQQWGSPQIAKIDGKDVVLTPNGELIRAADGVVLSKDFPALEYNSAMIYDGIVYTYNKNKAKAQKLPEKAEKDAKVETLWEVSIPSDRYYASPLFDGKNLHCVTKAGVYTALDAKTGKEAYQEKLKLGKGTYYPSPVLAGDMLLISIDNGRSKAYKVGEKIEPVLESALTPYRSCPIFDGNRMYVRTLDGMYCIGTK